MLRLISFFLVLHSAVSFMVSPQSSLNRLTWGTRTNNICNSNMPLRMFDAGGDDDSKKSAATTTPPPALQVTDDTKPIVDEQEPPKIKAVYKNLARGGEIEEVQWVDNAMTANTNPFEMSWWAYILFGFPFVLLLNDAFHFLPTEGPLSFLAKL